MNKAQNLGTGDLKKATAAREIIPVSFNTLEKLATECGAKYKIGRSTFYDVAKIEAYIRQQTA